MLTIGRVTKGFSGKSESRIVSENAWYAGGFQLQGWEYEGHPKSANGRTDWDNVIINRTGGIRPSTEFTVAHVVPNPLRSAEWSTRATSLKRVTIKGGQPNLESTYSAMEAAGQLTGLAVASGHLALVELSQKRLPQGGVKIAPVAFGLITGEMTDLLPVMAATSKYLSPDLLDRMMAQSLPTQSPVAVNA